MPTVDPRARSESVARWRLGDDVGPLRGLLRRGGVLAIPSESSYGLAVDPRSAAGVRAVFDIKGRPPGKPLPVVVAGSEQLPPLGVEWPTAATAGLDRLWPAALSLLLPVAGALPAAAGGDRLAVRVPAHPGLRRLLTRLGHGLTATSANLSGAAPALEPAALTPLLAGRDAVVVDAGVLPGGAPSTLVEVRCGVVTVLRPGRVGLAALRAAADGGTRFAAGDRFSAVSVEIPVEESS